MWVGSEREPQAELARALRDVVREYTVETDAREQRCERGKTCREHRQQAVRVNTVPYSCSHRSEVGDRCVGVDRGDHTRDRSEQRFGRRAGAHVVEHRLDPAGSLAARKVDDRGYLVFDAGVLRVGDDADDLHGKTRRLLAGGEAPAERVLEIELARE